MVIDLFQNGHQVFHYVSQDRHTLAHFANNTLCLRREAFEQLGGYSEPIWASEDVEICSRIAKTDWRMYRCPRMFMQHRGRTSIRKLLSQWWGYGINIPTIFKARNPGDVEAILTTSSGDCLRMVQRYNMPVTACVFVHSFLLMHLFFLVAVLLAVFGWKLAALACLVASAGLAWEYTRPDREQYTGPSKLIVVRYLVNLAFFLSHIVGSYRARCLYLPQTLWERRL